MGVDVDHADRHDGRRAVALVQSGTRWVGRIAAHERTLAIGPNGRAERGRLVSSLRMFRDLVAQHPVNGDQLNASGGDRAVSGTGDLR